MTGVDLEWPASASQAAAPGPSTELDARIAEADVVSFDVFDTLFVRPLCDPEDAFDVLGERFGIPEFRRLRREAQAEAFRRMQASGRREITLGGIYECFGALPVPAPVLQQAEYDLELALTLPDPAMRRAFHGAVAAGKRVVVASDMYLPLSFFEALLARHGMGGVPLFISSDRNATKRDHGELFDLMAAEVGAPRHRILHIGDNPLPDIRQAQAKGLATYHVRDPRPPRAPTRASPSASLAAALVRVHGEDVPSGSFHELGFRYGGPGVVGFLDWIEQEAAKDGIDRLLFVSRDGYALERCARARSAGRLPAFSYFFGSRVSFTLGATDERNFAAHLDFLLSGAGGLAPFEVLERVGVVPPADHAMEDLGLGRGVVVGPDTADRVRRFLFAYRWEILKTCRRNRQGLLRHILDAGARPGMRLGLVDVGWNGTTQEALGKALRPLLEAEVHGYYFCLAGNEECRRRRMEMPMKALVSDASVPAALLAALHANRVAVEFFFSAPHDPVIGYEPSARGVLPVEDPGRADAGPIHRISEEVVRGIERFAGAFERIRREVGLPPDPLGTAWPLLDFAEDGRWSSDPLLAGVKNFDAWASSRNRDMLLRDYAVPRPGTPGA